MMIVTGVLGALSGLAAIVRDETYVQTVNRLWIFDETAWGWIHLLIGIAVVAIGAMMLRGGVISMALGAGVIVLHMIAHFNMHGHVPVVVDGRDRDRRPHPLRHDRPRR